MDRRVLEAGLQYLHGYQPFGSGCLDIDRANDTKYWCLYAMLRMRC